MPGTASRTVLKHLNTLFQCGAAGPLADEALLERFVAGEAEAAEAAFTALVNRHGAMVLGVCRRVLGNRHAAEDAFQATFLVLARKAPAIARREQLASWLHGVARRAALDARARAARQQAREKRLGPMLPAEPPDLTSASEIRAVLDDELGRLPAPHRAAIVLCELEGLSRREAASRLGVTEGTLSSRLARAKLRLRDRLTRRGFGFTNSILASILTQETEASTVPPALLDSTIKIATLTAAGSSLTGVVSTSVITLTEGVLKAMLLAKLKLVILGLAAMALFTTGVRVLAQERPSDEDRLKNVERKLDRLLEVLGGPRHQTPTSTPTPAGNGSPTMVPPRSILPPGTPPTASSPPTAAPVPVPPVAAGAPGLPASAQPPPPPAIAAVPLPPGQGSVQPPYPRARRAQPSSLAAQVDALDQRLGELERRFAELQRRIDRIDHGAVRSPNTPADVPSISTTPTFVPASGPLIAPPADRSPTAGPDQPALAPPPPASSPRAEATPSPSVEPPAPVAGEAPAAIALPAAEAAPAATPPPGRN
jgi:RNA polymerase sigma factor (sigma-70 family)